MLGERQVLGEFVSLLDYAAIGSSSVVTDAVLFIVIIFVGLRVSTASIIISTPSHYSIIAVSHRPLRFVLAAFTSTSATSMIIIIPTIPVLQYYYYY